MGAKLGLHLESFHYMNKRTQTTWREPRQRSIVYRVRVEAGHLLLEEGYKQNLSSLERGKGSPHGSHFKLGTESKETAISFCGKTKKSS